MHPVAPAVLSPEFSRQCLLLRTDLQHLHTHNNNHSRHQRRLLVVDTHKHLQVSSLDSLVKS